MSLKTRRILTLAFAAVLVAAAAGCGAKKTEIAPSLAASDEALYKEAEKVLKKDPEKARLYLRQIIDSFPKSYYAQRAKLAVADTYFLEGDEGNLILAAAEYREFISLYPYSPSASLAQYRIGLCFFDKVLKPGRDQTKTASALAEFKKVLATFPLSDEAKLARERIKESEERLAEHAFVIGQHYYRVEAYKAAVSRLAEILTNYPAFAGMDRVYFHLGDAYFKWNKPAEAQPYFLKLVSDYPKSKYIKKAQERLPEIEALLKLKKAEIPKK